jgi:hypothetical protein
MRVLIASPAGMCRGRRGLALGLEPVRMPQTWWRVGERQLLRGEWGSTSTTLCDASWHWETAAHTREQDTHPAFIESHRSPIPEREWSGSRPPMRPVGAG